MTSKKKTFTAECKIVKTLHLSTKIPAKCKEQGDVSIRTWMTIFSFFILVKYSYAAVQHLLDFVGYLYVIKKLPSISFELT